MLSHIRARLRSEVAGIPFPFPTASVILEEDGLFLSRFVSVLSTSFDLPVEKMIRLAVVLELVRTTLEVHSRVSREKSQQDRFFENDKLAILAGDDLFTRALAEIPKLEVVGLQNDIHLRIREACRHRLLLSLGDQSWASPLLLSVFFSPALVRGKKADEVKLLSQVASAYGKNISGHTLPLNETLWLDAILAGKMRPETQKVLEFFRNELQRPLPWFSED